MSEVKPDLCCEIPSLEDLAETIQAYGFATMGIGGGPDTPEYMYTVGHKFTNNPDIIICGLPIDTSYSLLHMINEIYKGGMTFRDGMTDLTLATMPAKFRTVCYEAKENLMGQCYNVYNSDFNALQLFWCDSNGRFPWETTYIKEGGGQPLLYRTQ